MTALSGPSDIVSENAHSPAAGGARTILVVPDAQLLFSADFKRSGPDLILTAPDGDRFTVLDYFRHKKLPDLVTPDGATFGAKIIEALTGTGPSYQYAQATAPAPAAQVIGKVEKITGSATAIRNGVAITLNVGDTLNKSDIIQTGSNSTLGISLLDGTALNLSANTRMALNEFIFDANATGGNGSHLTLVQGAFAFISGLVAPTGGVNIETPVANIGIRGTVVAAVCSAGGSCEFSAGNEVAGSKAGQPSTFDLMAGGQYVGGQYVGGTVIGRVTVGTNVRITPTGLAQPEVTFVPSPAADPGLASAMQQVIQLYPQVFIPGPPGPAPAPPPGAPPGPAPGTAPQGGNNSGSTTAPDLLTPPQPPTPPPLQQNDHPENLQPLAAILAPTETLVAAIPAGQSTPEVIVTVSVASSPSSVTVQNPIFSQSLSEDAAWAFTVPTDTFGPNSGLTLAASMADGSPLPNWMAFDAATATFSGTLPPDANGSVQLKVVASDGNSAAANFFTLDVAPVNDAPVVANGGNVSLTTINENDVNPDGATVAALLTGHFSDVADEVPGGSHANALAGVAIYSNPANPAGVWEWSSDGTSWHPIATDLSDSNALVLDASTRVRFVPSPGFHGDAPALLGRLIDDSSGGVTSGTSVDLVTSGVGGSTPYSAASVIIDEIVNVVPTTTPVTLAAIAEDSGPRLITQGELLANASDVDGPSLMAVNLQVSSGGGSLDDNGNGTWTYHPALNDDTSVTFSYSVTDGVAPVATTANLDITPASDAPVVAHAIADQNATQGSQFTFSFAANTFSDVDGDPLLYTASLDTDQPLPAWLHFDGSTRTFSGTPTNADVGTVAVKVTASDGTLSVSDIFNIAVGNTNDAPVIQGVGGTVPVAEDASVLLQAASALVTDADGDTLTMTLGVSGGSLAPSQAILDAIAAGTLTGLDVDGLDGSLQVRGSAAAITAAIQAGITYAPNANVNGLDALDVAITDGQATTNASLAINITPVNDAPVTTPVTLASIAEDSGPRLIMQAELLANASDVEGPLPLSAINLQISAGSGSLDDNGNGTWTYHPALNDDTSVTFSYSVTDGVAAPVATTASLDITQMNDAPDTAAGSGSGNEDTTIAVSLSGSDIDGSVASFKITSLPVSGTLYADAGLTDTLLVGETVAATGNAAPVYFRPNLNSNGSDSFTYAAVDNNGAQDATPATAAITVTPVNDAPVVAHAIADQNATQGGAFSFQFAANTFNDVDVGDALTYTATLDTNAPLPAWLSFNASTRTFSGTPQAGDIGTVAVKVTATDGSTASVSDTFNIAVGNTNDAPVIQGVGGTVPVAEDASVLLQAASALVTDADGDTLTMTLGVSGGRLTPSQAILDAIASHALTSSDSDGNDGTLSVTGSAAAITAAIQAGITYAPNANVNGLDALDVAITDGQATTNASLAINITPVNDAPVTTPVTLASIAEDSGPRLITQAQLLVNASDVDGPSPLTAINLQISAGNGTLDDNGNGTWTYHPALSDDTSVTLSYSVTDGTAAVATTASLDITPVNDVPVTSPVTLAAIAEDSGARLITQAQLLANASDVDGPSPLTATNLQISAGNGTLDDNGNGTWTYHPALNDSSSVSFSYSVTDGVATVATSASLDITSVNDAPATTPVTLVAIVEDSGPRLITQAELLVNASDVDGPSPLTATNLQISAGNGTLDDNGNGTWTYHPALNDNTSVTFSYSVTDGVTPVTTSASLDIIDTAAPAAVATVTALSADTGTAGDFITSVALQTVSGSYAGTLGAGEKIQVSADGATWVDATAAAGLWSASGVTLVAGTGTLSVRTIDAANNTTAGTGHSYTLDQTAPAAAVAITAIATDSGTAGDFITNDTTLIVSGTNGALGAGEKVQISSNGANWFDVTQTTGTTWSYDDSGTPHLSNVTYQVRVIDAAANVGNTASQLVIVDTAAPAAGTLSFSNLTDSGTPNTPPVTTDNAFDLSLAGQETAAGTTTVYQVSVNGGAFANTTANQSALADGSYQFRALVTDAAGNSSTSNSIAVVVDTAAPAAGTLSFASLTDTGTANTPPVTQDNTFDLSLTGQETAAGTTTVYQVSVNGGAFANTTPNQSALANGDYVFRAVTTDAAGNSSTSNSIAVVVDNSAPAAGTLSFANLTDTGTANTPPVTQDNTFDLSLAGQETAAGTTTVYQVSVNGGGFTTTTANQSALADGSYQFRALVTDAAGNASTSNSIEVVVDTTAPAAGALSFANLTDTGTASTPPVTQDNTFDLSLAGQEAGTSVVYQVSVNGGGFTTTTANQSALADGSYQFRALVTDAAGNASTSNSIAVVVDTAAPAAGTLSFANLTDSGTPNTPPVTTDNAFDLSLAGQEAGASVVYQVSVNGGAFANTTASQSGLANGDYVFRAVTTDAAGNASTSNSIAVVVDTAAPAAGTLSFASLTDTGTANTPPVTQDNTFDLSLTGQETAAGTTTVYQVSVNGGAFANTTPNQSALANGDYVFRAVTTDAAGNASTSNSIAVVVDSSAPAAVATVTGLSADTGTAGDFITSVASQTVSGSYTGTLLAGEKIQVSVDGATWVDATAASGLWSASGVTLVAGSGTLSVRTIDAASNTTAGTGHGYTLTITGDNNDNVLVGTSAADWIEGLGGNDMLQGLAGNDLLDGGSSIDRAIYTDAAVGPITVDMAAGTVTGDASVGTDTLVSIEQIRGTAFNDVYVATGYTGGTPIGSLQTNFNEFEGMAGDDIITGNGATQLAYRNATAGVIVNFTSWVAGQGASGTATGDASVGTDTFTGVQVVYGSEFADTFHGSNNLTGVEVFQGRGGDDFIDGGGGFDRVLYGFRTDNNVTGGITINMAAGTVIGDASVGHDTLRSIEAARGTNFADTYDATGFTTTSVNGPNFGSAGFIVIGGVQLAFNEFEGLGGNDTITGNGNTRIDYINATAAVTVDLLAGTATGDVSVGADTFTGVNSVQGSYFADTLYGSNNVVNTTESFDGGAGDDTIDGRGGVDQAYYNNAVGTVSGVTVGMAAGTVVGDASIGTDTLRSIESVRGTNFADTYDATGFSGSSTNAGSNGTFNSFEGLAGNDAITGNGNTQLTFFSATGGVTVNFNIGTVTGDASVGTDTFTGVNNVQGTNFNDTMIGAIGNQTLAGRGGADTFVYADNGGADVVTDFNHGQGDKIDLTGVTGVYSLADVQAIATQVGPNTVITFGFGNTLTLNGVTLANLTASDFIFANPANHIVGDNNDNILVGTSGIDWIEGLGGHDTLQGLAGNDLLDGGSGLDRAIYTDATGSITVDLAAGTAHGTAPGDLANVGTDTLVSIEQIRGSDFADTYVATGYAGVSPIGSVPANFNEFEGMAGNDTITGNGGTQLSYITATAGVTVNFTSWVAGQGASGTATGDASVGTDTFSGVQVVRGSEFADTFHGSNNLTGVEVFQGRGGDDFIDGGGGFDRANYWFRTDDNVTGGITVNMAAGTVVGDASVGTDTLRSIEAVRGTNFADTYDATGFTASSTNAGSAGVNNVGAAFNEFEGLGGNDSITGNGNTRISYINATDGVTVDIAAGTAQGTAAGDLANVGNDTLSGVNAVQGSWFADTLYGSNNPTGTAELFDGGAGDDTIDGRGAFDQAYYNGAVGTASGISVDMAAGTVVGDASIGTDTLRSIESVRGTNFADTYDATGFGQAGALNIGSSGTFNEFEGLAGDDTIIGNGNTRVTYVSATGGVTVDIAAGTATGDASVGTDNFTGVSQVRGSQFADTLSGDGNNNTLDGQNGNDVLDGRGGNDTLIGGGGADTFVYADNGGADVVTDFNHGQGDRIDLSAVTGIYSLVDVQAIATQVGPNTVITFGVGNTLTLNNVTLASLTANDFVFAPHITGDLALTVVKGDSVPVSPDDYSFVVITANDFHAVYPGTPANQITFTVSDPTHGWVALVGAPATPITNFTEAQLEAGLVVFVHDGSDTTQATFKISASDGVDPATPPTTVIVTVPNFTITAQNAAGLDFMNDNTIESIGSGVVQSGGTSSTFTVVDIAANRDFVFEGAGFVYGAGNAITGGTIFAFHVLAHDTQSPLAEFNGRVDATEFFAGAVAAAAGDQSLFNALTAQWTSTFIGAGGDDSSGTGDNNDFFRVSGGNDTFNGGFGFDRANYTSAAGPIEVLLAGGTVTKYADTTKTSIAGVDVLQSIEHITGSDFRDTFNAVGFSASSPNAGSTVTFNTAGTRNEFEGRGGDDAITGNGNTRISYLHATAGVMVTFSSWVSGQGASGTAVGNSSVGTDSFTGINGVRGSYFDDVFIGSNNVPNTTEFFEGRGGNDLINGGGGFDKASYFFEDSGISVHMAAGKVVGGANTGTDTLLSVESVIGTDFADTYTAAIDGDPLYGSGVAFGAVGAANVGSNGTFNEFEGAGGNDTITGNGNTRVAFYDATAGVTVTLGANGSGTSFGTEPGDLADVGTDTFVSGVKDLRGSEFGDIITGNGGNNILEGQGGNDIVNGRGGNDTLTGGTGSDIFVYNTNVTNGNIPPSNNDTITDFNSGEGDKIDLRGISGINNFGDVLAHVPGGSPNTIQIDATDNLALNVPVGSLHASDFIFNGQVAVTVQTADGYDFSTLYDDMAGSIGAIDPVDASHFTATNAARGLVFAVTVSNDATPGDPTTGAVNAIDIYDLEGHILANTNGWNFLASDLNTALLTYAGDHSQTSGLDAIFGTVSYSAVGNFVGANAFNNNSINFGSDTFLSGIGNDVFNGLTNENGDFFNGGDTVDYSHAPGGVTVSLLSQGISQNTGGAGFDTLINIESLRGSAFNDTLTSNGFSAVLEGGPGNDTLIGQVGGNETVSYEHATGPVTVNMLLGTADGNASVGHDTISNFEVVRGSAYADTLTGNDGSVLEGGLGGDQLIGNVTGSNASITASYQHASAGVTVSLPNPGSNTGEAAGDTFVFVSSVLGQHFNLQGSQFNDTLIGDNNDNVLNGWGTRDNGSDTLTGNLGADTFVFSGSHVTITDFNHSQNDKIDLSFLNFGTGISQADLQSLITAAAPGAQTLDFGNEQTVTVNVNVNSLQLGDFLGLHA